MNITGLPPACGDIPAEVCVTVDAAVGTGVISADVAAFDAAAVPALLIAAHKERRACDALDQRLVNAAVVLDSVSCKVGGLRTGGKNKPVLLSDAGKLPREAVERFGGKPVNVQPVQAAAVFGGVNVHKAEYAFFGIRSQGGSGIFKAFQMKFGGILVGEQDRIISPDHPLPADFFGEPHKGFQTPGKLRDIWLNLPAVVVDGELKIIVIIL